MDALNEHILDAAHDTLLRYGYDKTTMTDIAQAAGVAKSTIYLRWNRKDDLLQTLLWREMRRYLADWQARVDSDPQPSFSSIFSAALEALHASPFIDALYRRERHLLGALMQDINLSALYQRSQAMLTHFLQEMQAVGAARQDINPQVVAYLADCLEYGHLMMGDILPDEQTPPTDDIIRGMVQMIERTIQPDNGGNPEGEARVIRKYMQQIAAAFDDYADDDTPET